MKFAPSLLVCVLGALGLAFSEIPAQAQVYTWTGPSGSATSPITGNWNTGSSWTSGLPVSGTTTELDFSNSGTNAYTSNNNISTFTLNKMVFTSTSTGLTTVNSPAGAGSGGFVFDGTAPEIDQNGSGTVYLESPMTLNTNLTIGGTGTGILELGAISGNFGVTFNGSGTYELGTAGTSASGWTGATTLDSGTLLVATGNQFASLILNGGTISSVSTAAQTLGNAMSFGGNVTVGNATKKGALTFTSLVTTTAASTITTPSETLFTGGVSNGANALTFDNTGTSTTGGSLNVTGATVGSAAMTFNNESNETITITGATIGSGGMIFGGTGSGTMTLSSAVSLGSGGITANSTGTSTTAITATTSLSSASSFTNSGLAALNITGAITDNNFALDFVDSGTGALNYNVATAIGTGGWTTSGSGPGIITLGGLLSGTGGLTNAGATTVLSSGSSTFSGGFVQNSGYTKIGAGSTGSVGALTSGPLGIGTVTINGGQFGSSTTTGHTLNNTIDIGTSATVIFGGTGTNSGAMVFGGVTNISNGAAIGAASATTFTNTSFNATGSLELLANSAQLTLPIFDASNGLTIDFVLGTSTPVFFTGGIADFSNTPLSFNLSGSAVAGTEYIVLDYTSGDGSLTLADLPTTIAGYSNPTWTIQSGDLEVEFASVPEPSPYLLLGLAALLFGAIHTLRNRFRLQAARH